MIGVENDLAAQQRIFRALEQRIRCAGISKYTLPDDLIRDLARSALIEAKAPMLPGDMIVIGGQ